MPRLLPSQKAPPRCSMSGCRAGPVGGALFKSDMAVQGRLLMQTIGTAVAGLDDLPALTPIVQDLGVRHARYGVQPEHYETVGEALLWTLRQGLGDGFTPEVRVAWTEIYALLAQVMQDAAASQGAG